MLLRTAIPEVHVAYARAGIQFPVTALFSSTYITLSDRQIKKFGSENPFNGEAIIPLADLGQVRENKLYGLHFAFADPRLGVCLLRNADDPDKYRGSEFMTSFIEELTELSRDQYEGIRYATRGGGLPFSTMLSVSNPDGRGAGWVKKLFVDRDFADEPEGLHEKDFIFIQSYVHDNPAATQDDIDRLRSNPNEMLVKSRYLGEWDVLTGLRFSQFSRKVHLFEWQDFFGDLGIPAVPNPIRLLQDKSENLGLRLYGSFDYGTAATSASVLYLHAVDWKKKCWTFSELTMSGYYLDEQAKIVKDYIAPFGRNLERIYCDPALQGRDDNGLTRIDRFRELGVRMIPASNDRIEGWASLDAVLFYDRDEAGRKQGPPSLRVHPTCKGFIRDILNAPRDEKKPEDVDPEGGVHHWLDAMRYFVHTHYGPGFRQKEPIAYGSKEWLRVRLTRTRDKARPHW